jgi:hypothetical protein
MVHIMEVYCVALPPAIIQQRTIDNPWLQFTRNRKTLAGNWTVTTTLSTLTDAIPPEAIEEYREAVRELRAQSSWTMQVPAGQTRPHQRSDFGRLPVSWESAGGALPRPVKTISSSRPVTPAPATRAQAPAESTTPAGARITTDESGARVEIRYRRKKRHRRRSRETKKAIIWQAVVGFVLVVILMLLAIEFARKTSSKIIRQAPSPDELEQQQAPNH